MMIEPFREKFRVLKIMCLFPLNRIPVVLLVLYMSILFGCAVNPATKKKEFMLVSESKEFKIGQGVDKQVREEMGFYLELPKLRSAVKEMGESIGRQSDRPDLIYRIEIVDSPDFNAFAVPGGFVYVNRGLLERINSSDELASVLGHEIAHVSARHSAAQISKVQLLNIGLLGIAVGTKGAVQDYGELINLGSVLAFSKFTRDDEREADHFGTAYAVRAGYNPKASIDTMKQIQKLHAKEPSTLETWFMSHPPTSERIENLTHEIDALRKSQPEVLERTIKRNEFIRSLDGLAIGKWNGSELVKGDNYYNKEYCLKIAIPDGWLTQINSKQYASVFMHPQKAYIVYLSIEPLRDRMDSPTYFRDFEDRLIRIGFKKIDNIETEKELPNNALASVFKGYERKMGPIFAEAIAFTKGTNGFSMTCVCKQNDFEDFQRLAEAMAKSFQFISQEKASKIEPARMKIHEIKPGDTWNSIAKKYFKSSKGIDKLADYNGYDKSHNLIVGDLLKIPPTLHIR